MQYLFQYPIETNLVIDKDHTIRDFHYEKVIVKLLLSEELIYTKSKKIQIIIAGENYNDALKKLYLYFHKFYDKLIFFTKTSVEIGYLELVLKNEKNKMKRTMLYDIIHIDKKNTFWEDYQHLFYTFLNISIDKEDEKIIYYLRRAIEAQHIYDKYHNIFKALESMIGEKEFEYRACPKCETNLICPKCKEKIKFKRLNNKTLKKAHDKIKSITNMFQYDYKTMLDYRHWCSHPVDKGKIDMGKANKFASTLFLEFDEYLRDKYQIDFMSSDIGRPSGKHSKFCQSIYSTEYPEEDFALDVLSMEHLEQNCKYEHADFDSF